MKVINKTKINERVQKNQIIAERHVLTKISHPFVVRMSHSFQSDLKLYFIMEYLSGGELFKYLKRVGKFSEENTRFYAAEVILALEYLHANGIVYRDLKSENILLDEEGHIKLTDFGLSKIGVMGNSQCFTFCGTPEYLAPEVLLGKGHNKNVDWWGLGLLIYEMLSGSHPFRSKNKSMSVIFNEITDEPIVLPAGLSEAATDLLSQLLKIDPSERLGSSELDAEEIKSHEFFKEVNWEECLSKIKTAPYIFRIANFDIE